MLPWYRKASSVKQKSKLLDAFTAATGYNRKYAMSLLNHAQEGQSLPERPRPRQYGSDVQHALFLVWNAANRICAKRLIPFLPILIEALEGHEHFQIWRGMPQATAFHEREPQPIACWPLSANRVSVASPLRERERCSSSRSPSAPSRSGMRPDPAFWKQIWLPIVE